ncbi:MAG TPA: aldehyde ferredoxin oxidoreductase family protein [Candidatus Deferrimicrobiaceae bacterium]|nr:aldehyde ferredoxin oxidoreductase family protein [Candidatus Deferrimicrobiaceae bacterium]
MKGWTGVFLNVNLTKNTAVSQQFEQSLAHDFLGGRGFAAKILWDRLKAGTDPLSPENLLIFATGPLTGIGLPNSGKLVVAAKSPLTGGYGDGNIGTLAAVYMRKAGYDGLVIEGKASSPVILHIKDDACEFLDAKEYWGKSSFETEAILKQQFPPTSGVVSIGQAGENLVKFATVVSQEGRSGGRPGMGAVMGSKNLKALVVEGTQQIPLANPAEMRKLAADGYKEVLSKPLYPFWKRQGTMSTVEWCQENSTLPTYNYREGVFSGAEAIGGFAMEKMKVGNRGCPQCNMTCGNIVKDSNDKDSELDYENVAMLGSNIGLCNLAEVSTLNRFADEFGLDTISLGNVLGFALEASEKGLISEKIHWGNFEETKSLVNDIAFRRGVGRVLAEGVRSAAKKIGGGSNEWAMHVKGLEVSAYDCHMAPAMALAYGTSSIGAHHKDAWVITWEIKAGRGNYDSRKVDFLIQQQLLRGGLFEALGVCRFAYNSLGLGLDWYQNYLRAATGEEFSIECLNRISDRILTLIRSFWVREYGEKWNRYLDVPPMRWFKEPLTEGALKGAMLDLEQYDVMLDAYYEKRGWSHNGVPKKETMERLGLMEAAKQLHPKPLV